MERIKNALVRSWQHDHIAFLFEMIGMLFTIAGSLLYPLFLVGASTGLFAYYRREMVWTILLTAYFVVINIVGFFIALG